MPFLCILYYIVLVATIFTSVPRISAANTSPTCTGASAVMVLSSAMQSNIFSLAKGRSVFTGKRGRSAPWIRTVEVTVRTGCCNSFLQYSAPLGQLLPVTAKPFSSSTLRWQPLGQVMHISSVMPDPPPRSP